MVQIKNRITGLYDRKGRHGSIWWTNKMHQRGAWGSISNAKSHITQYLSEYSLCEDSLRNYLNSDFEIMDDNYNVQIQPIAEWLIPKLKDFIIRHEYSEWHKENVEICKKLISEFE
jgi:hypothetical protein